jgi:Fe-S-cluster-containing hydrogenase component 2
MACVITDPCNEASSGCGKPCERVCPVDAIHGPAAGRRFIDPEACICCNACVPQCPAESIFDADALAPEQEPARQENAAFFQSQR